MHQRKVSALVALVGSASLGLAVGCGNGAHQESTAQRSLGGPEQHQAVEFAASPTVEAVPMPDWLRGPDTGVAESTTTALQTPPIVRGRKRGDDLGEPPTPMALSGLDADTKPKDVTHRNGFKSAGHVRLARALSPNGYFSGTVSGRQLVAELVIATPAVPQISPRRATADHEPIVDDQHVAIDNDVNSLSIIRTTGIGTTGIAPETIVSKVAPGTAIPDTATPETIDEPAVAIADVVMTEADTFEPSVVAPPAAKVTAQSPRNMPRLQADLRPWQHPLASIEPKQASRPAESFVTTDLAPAQTTKSRTHSYDAMVSPPLIVVRELPVTPPPAAATPVIETPVIEAPVVVAATPVELDAPTQVEPQKDALEVAASENSVPRSVEMTPAPTLARPAPPVNDLAAQRQAAVQLPSVARAPAPETPIAQQRVVTAPVAQVPTARPPVTPRPVAQQRSVAPAPRQVVARPTTPRKLAVNHPAPKRFTAPVVVPHGGVRAPAVRTIPIQRRPAQTRHLAARPTMSREMLAVRKMADRHTFAGFDFASRRALYSAEAEFISSLRVLSRAMDRLTNSKEHAAALADGILAIEESDDFLASGSELEADFDVGTIVAGHRTEVLQNTGGLEEMTPLVAVQRYYAFAQQRLADAVGGEPSGSFALYGLGKLHASLAAEPGANPEALEPKAMAYHQAALMASPVNHMAANELAVLLARYGQLGEARNLLLHSVSIMPQPSTWHNLAVVHAQLGEQRLSEAAAAEHSVAQQRSPGNQNDATVSPVRWLVPSEFSRTSDQTRSPATNGAASQTTMQVAPVPQQQATTPVHQASVPPKQDGGMFGLFRRK